MVAYSFQKRFIGHVHAGLEPGPWCPGMKRHTLRQPRKGRQGHARPEQPVHLYTAMRTKHCRMIGKAVARVQIPVTLFNASRAVELVLIRREGAAPRSRVAGLAPIVQQLLDMPPLHRLEGEEMEEFARTDGFSGVAEMAEFFGVAEAIREHGIATLYQHLVLVGWSPAESGD
jgi:hypothetical protein